QTVTLRRPVFSSLLTTFKANPISHSNVNTLLEVEINVIPLSNAKISLEILQNETE
ncbi:4009_t:CDS:1, partial [Funneliformis geosporum]